MVRSSNKLALFSVYVSIFGSNLQYAIVYPFASYMVRELGDVKSRSNTGFWAGILGGSIMLAKAIAYPISGIASDRFGRRPMLLVALVWLSIFSLLFGMSVNLWMAIIVRFAQGLFSCISGVSKTIISEVCPGPKQANAMSWFSLIMVMATVLGLVFGGLLCSPDLTNNEFLSEHPFLIPSFIPSFFCLLGYVTSYFFLNETLKKEHLGSEGRSLRDILSDRTVIKVQIVYYFVALVDTTTIEIFTLWCYANKEDGGFELDPFKIGLILSISCAIFAPFQKVYFDYLSKKLTLKKILKIHICAQIFVFAVAPSASLLRYHDMLGKVALVAVFTLIQSMIFPMITCVFIFTNNCAIPEERGRVNGASMTVACLGRGIGPVVFGYVFSKTTQSGLPFPLNFAFSYECLALILFLNLLIFSTFPESLNYPKQEITSNLLSNDG